MEINFRSPGSKVLGRKILTAKKLSEATQRLNSGERINSAADDAAGLAVSEKLRSIDRGLRQGMRNLSDGLNYIDTVDSCTQEINDILHRLKELAVESANGPYSNMDRSALDLEYQQLLDEINQMTDTSMFNTIPLFDQHEPVYTFMPGNIVHNEPITIDSSNDLLIVSYSVENMPCELSINIPHGTFSADELADEIDDYLYGHEPNLIIGVNENNQFTLQSENGHIDTISGSGATLFYDIQIGAGNGNLMGTTHYITLDGTMEIKAGVNNEIKFHYGETDNTVHTVTLDPGEYNYEQIINHMNDKFAEAGFGGQIKAVADKAVGYDGNVYNIISVLSDKDVTGLKGNFIQLNDGSPSPLFDICTFSTRENQRAVLDGFAIPGDSDHLDVVKGINDYFNLEISYYTGHNRSDTKKIRVDLLEPSDNGHKTFSNVGELIDKMQHSIDAALEQQGVSNDKLPIVEVKRDSDNTLRIESVQYGDKCSVKLDRSDIPSDHLLIDFFDYGTLRKVKPYLDVSEFYAASYTSNQNLNLHNGVDINNSNNTFTLHLGDETVDLHLTAKHYANADAVVNELRTQFNASTSANIGKIVFSSTASGGIKIEGNGHSSKNLESIFVDENCSAYKTLIKDERFYDNMTKSDGARVPYGKVEVTIVPGGKNPNIIMTPGRDNGISYDGSTVNISAQKVYQIGHYREIYAIGKNDIITKKGKDGHGYENEVGGEVKGGESATMQIKNIASQFFNRSPSAPEGDQQCIENLDFGFVIVDNHGDEKRYSVTIPKGTKLKDCKAVIESKCGDDVTVDFSGNDMILTSLAHGDKVEFKDTYGSLLRCAKETDLAKDSDVNSDIPNNTAWIPSKTVLNVSSHFANGGFKVDQYNNTLSLADAVRGDESTGVGGNDVTITIPDGTYITLDDLKTAIDTQLRAKNSVFSVSCSGNNLIFTGKDKSRGVISVFGTTNLDKIKKDEGGKTAATLNVAGANTRFTESGDKMKVTAPNNTITMNYGVPGSDAKQQLKIEIPNGTYTLSQMVTAIRTSIQGNNDLKDKITVQPNADGKGFTFSTVGKGTGYVLSDLDGTLGFKNAIFKAVPEDTDHTDATYAYTSAVLKNNKFDTLFDGNGLVISDSNNTLAFKVNNTSYRVTLTNGTYTNRDAFIRQVNTDISRSGIAIRGQIRAEYDVMTETFKLKTIGNSLTGGGVIIDIDSSNTSPLFKLKDIAKDAVRFNMQDYRCGITGTQTINGQVEIGSWNNEMTFDYTTDNNYTSQARITIPVDPDPAKNMYDAEGLKNVIQQAINNSIGTNQLTVTVRSDNRLHIEASDASTKRGISNFKGELFRKVFQGAKYPYDINGVMNKCYSANGSSPGTAWTFTFGNNLMEPRTIEEIEANKNLNVELGVNDELKFDFKYNSQEHTISIHFPEGLYTKDEIAAEIQKQAREQIKSLNILDHSGQPLDSDRFYAVIGLNSLGISTDDESVENLSSDFKDSLQDKLFLAFKEYEDGSVVESDARIDGVRGSSSYRIFYASTKTPGPSRATGGADLRDGVIIKMGENDMFGFSLDGEQTMISIPGGYYTADEISNFLTKKLEDMGSIVRTHITKDGTLMLYTGENGDFDLGKVRGSGANDLFYGGSARDNDEEGPGIHYGRRTDSYIWMKKSRIDAHLMRINTTGISTAKRASKAINRLDFANEYLLKYRAQHGAYENRIERTYDRNTVQTENLEKSESSIRDTDIPMEIMNYTKQSIINQLQDFMLKQDQELAQNSVTTIMNQKG